MSLWQDIQFSLRTIRRSPRVSVIILLTLALGIGANTAIFSIVNAAILQSLPFQQPGQLVQLSADERGAGAQNVGFSYPELQDLRDAGIFQAAAGVAQVPGNLTGGDHPERLDILVVSPNYFSILGSKPQLGRLFDSRDKTDGFAEGAIISNGLWHKQFGGDSNILGHRVRLDNDLYTIVGVLPPSFRSPNAATASDIDIWITAGFHALPFLPPARDARVMEGVLARLNPDITIEQAQARLRVFATSLRQNYRGDYPAASGWTPTVTPLKDVVVGNSRTLLLSLLVAALLILLIACVNVANLLLANASARQREFSIRVALGADRARVLRQVLTEAAMLSLAGMIVGTAAATVSLRFLIAILPSQLPHVTVARIDGRVLAFSLLVAMLTTLLFGLVPALKAARAQPEGTSLRTRSVSTSLRDAQLGKTLVGLEVALSLMLLVGAGLLLRTFWDLLHVDTGFQAEHLVAGTVWLPVPNDPKSDIYATTEERAQLIREILRRLKVVPGVESAAISSVVPLQNPLPPVGFRAEGASSPGDAPAAVPVSITPDFFKTLGTSLIRGRSVMETDTTRSSMVALVDEAAAHRYWNGHDPIGRRIRLSGDVVADGKSQLGPWMTVVGIVRNAKLTSLDEQNVPHVYSSMYQNSEKLLGVLVRATGEKAELGQAIRRSIRSVDPNLPVSNINEMTEIVNTGAGLRRFAAWLLSVFAGIALLLTGIGIYGVASYAITRRVKEFGIRSVMGATRGSLVQLAVKDGISPILIGLTAGVVGAMLSARLISGLLFAVKSDDLTVFTIAGATVVLIGIAANYIPARRAARVEPIVALRVE